MPGGSFERGPLIRVAMDFMRGPATWLVWLTAAGAAAFLFNHRSHRYECAGLARGLEHRVASTVLGRIDAVTVGLCDDVRAGEIVARLDDSLLTVRIETAHAAIRQQEARLAAARINQSTDDQSRQTNWRSKLADLESREEKDRIELLGVKVTIESDRVDEERVALDADRSRKLLEAHAGSQQDYDRDRLRRDQLLRRINENTALAARIEKNCAEARSRREEFVKQAPQARASDELLAPIREAIHQQELELEELRVKREATVLRAPVSGRVTQVLCQAGQAVTPGEPIVVIGSPEATQVLGYLPEKGAGEVKENMRVRIARANQPLATAEAAITRLFPGVEEIPARFWRDPHRPEFGRCFLVSAPAAQGLIPGEQILIHLEP